ncbi:hypothetical protein LTR66_008049 [Elasticomyces elasticus]|nr:hypothetical protein LTR66_008049 [Elasticomyces elasticus]KAK4988675.1 hypothetical protein LTR50_003754 [Elasticomyces elasticus]
MADQAAKDAAAQERIITHMNNDHHDSVIRYLEHYHKLPSYSAFDGKISGITLSDLELRCRGSTYKIPFDPPMQSYREARERVVKMDQDAVAALGRSDLTVKEFLPPYGLYAVVFVVVLTTFIAFSTRSNFAPGSVLGRFVPRFASFCWTVQPFVLYFMLFMHTAEATTMARGRLRKHSVNVRTGAWWKWVGSTFIEGVWAFRRFDEMIKQKRIEKEKQKH